MKTHRNALPGYYLYSLAPETVNLLGRHYTIDSQFQGTASQLPATSKSRMKIYVKNSKSWQKKPASRQLPITLKSSQSFTYGEANLCFGSSCNMPIRKLATFSPIEYSLPLFCGNQAVDHSCGSYNRRFWPSSARRHRHCPAISSDYCMRNHSTPRFRCQ